MKLQYLRDWDAVDTNDGETLVKYIDDNGENGSLVVPTWLLNALAAAHKKAPCMGNDDNPAAWCNGCMEDIKEELREQELANRGDPYRALSTVRTVLQKKLILGPDHLYTPGEVADLLHHALEEVESHDLFEK